MCHIDGDNLFTALVVEYKRRTILQSKNNFKRRSATTFYRNSVKCHRPNAYLYKD